MNNGSSLLIYLAEASKEEKQTVIKIMKQIPCSGFLGEGETVSLLSI